MRFMIISLFIFLFLIIAVSCSTNVNINIDQPAEKTNNVFPTVSGKNLLGDHFVFPKELNHDYNLLAIAFLREQQSDVDTWISNMEELEKKYDNFMFYELPTIKKMDPFSKWFIYKGMQGGIPSEHARKRTVTLHIDKIPFKKSLGIDNEQKIYLFLVNRSGTIIWRNEQLWTKDKQEQLEDILNKHKSQ